MAKTVAEILVDQMVEVGIRKVYGIVGDSANPIVDALRRHQGDIEFVHVRNEEAGAFAAGADAQISGIPTAVLGSSGPGQPAPAQRPVRLPAQRAPRSSPSRRTSPAPRSAAATSRRPTPRRSSPAARTTPCMVSSAGQMPRVSELALQAAILDRGVGMVILPGDVAAEKVDKPMLGHPILTDLPVARPTDAALDKAVAMVARGEEDRHPRRRGHAADARDEVLAALGQAQGARLVRLPRQGRARGDNPSGVGMTGLLGWGGATEALADCDLLFMLGTDFPYHAFLPSREDRSSRSTTSRSTSDVAQRSTWVWSVTWARRCGR